MDLLVFFIILELTGMCHYATTLTSLSNRCTLKKTLYEKVFLTEAKLQHQCPWNTKEECGLRKRGRKTHFKKNIP